jgi:hypothetical protein
VIFCHVHRFGNFCQKLLSIPFDLLSGEREAWAVDGQEELIIIYIKEVMVVKIESAEELFHGGLAVIRPLMRRLGRIVSHPRLCYANHSRDVDWQMRKRGIARETALAEGCRPFGRGVEHEVKCDGGGGRYLTLTQTC